MWQFLMFLCHKERDDFRYIFDKGGMFNSFENVQIKKIYLRLVQFFIEY